MSFFDHILNRFKKITALNVSFNVSKMKAEGAMMTNEEFDEDRFDQVFQLMRRRSNAENLTFRLGDLYTKDRSIDGELIMVVVEDGIAFEGVESWLSQNYAYLVPQRADEASAAAAAHLEDDEKRGQIILGVKRLFWRHTARSFVEEAESQSED